MKTLLIGDPSGSHCAQLIEKKNIIPEDIVVWENCKQHEFRIKSVSEYITTVQDFEFIKHMKFPNILGNPPFQNSEHFGSMRSSGVNPLWWQITKNCLFVLEDDGILALITPVTIFQGGDTFTKDFIGENAKYDFISIDFDVNKYFNIGIEICSWILRKRRTEGFLTKIGDKEIDIKKGQFLSSDPIRDSLLNKVYSYSKDHLNFNTNGAYRLAQLKPLVKKGIATLNDLTLSNIKTESHKYLVDVNGKIKYLGYKMGSFGKSKVLVPRMSTKIQPYYSKEIVGDPSTFNMEVSNMEEGENLVSLLNTKFYRFAFNSCKISARISYKINNLPKLDLSKKWNDDLVFSAFNLTDEEITYIESNV
jgi:hypothetical protein